MTETIDLDDLGAELQKLIEKLPEYAMQAAEPAMNQAMLYLHGQVPPYPRQAAPGEQHNQNWTPKSRAWFFFAVRAGKIPGWKWVEDEHGGHPEGQYERTNTLGRRITTGVQVGENSVLGEIGTNTKYAPWVIGPEYPGEQINGAQMYQAKIHSDRWWRLYDVVETNAADTWDVFEDELLAGITALFTQE